MLFCDIHCVENSLDSVLFPLRNSIVNWSVKPLPYYFASALYAMVVSIRPPTCGLPVAILEFVVYRDPTGCLTAFYFSPFEVRDDSNPSGDGLPHLSRIKLGGAATDAPFDDTCDSDDEADSSADPEPNYNASQCLFPDI